MIPKLTHFQFAVASLIDDSEVTGHSLRTGLRSAFGIRKDGPAFYQAMSRMEDAGFVDGRYEPTVIAGQAVRLRCYKLKAAGRKAVAESKVFYGGLLT